jgi:transcriptional regulator GlxA family with amidase domain
VPPDHLVVLVAFDDLQVLDLAGPVEVLSTANLLGAQPPYRTMVVSPNGGPVRSASGLELSADVSLSALARGRARIGTLVVVGGIGYRRLAGDEAALRQLRAIAARSDRVTSVCTGALVLAAAGLLDGYCATTHWSSCDDLAAEHPEVDVRADRIFVHDRDRWTSAGVTAGIDLFLALIDADHSADLARSIAGWLVVFVRRPGGQAQFSAQLLAEPASDETIARLQRWLPDHLDADLGVEVLARRVGMSPRTFARAFRRETGSTPASFVERLRVEAACRLLEASDLTVGAVAQRVGLRHAETLHRVFRRQVGTTPDRYRQHFARRVG